MQNKVVTFSMFAAQAWYVRDIIMGRIDVPERDARLADVEDRVAREDFCNKNLPETVSYLVDYLKELIAETDYPNFDVDSIKVLFSQMMKNRFENITGFRDNCFKSPITGCVSPLHHTLWKDNFDDSLESYLRE